MAGDAFRKIIVAGRLVKPGSCRRGVKVCAARDPRLFPEPRLLREDAIACRKCPARRVSNIRPPGKTPMAIALIEDASLDENGNIFKISRLSAPTNSFASFHARSTEMEGWGGPRRQKKKVVSVRVTCILVPSLNLVWAACDMQLLPVAGDNNAWCMQVVGSFVRDDRRPPTRQTEAVVRQSGPREHDALREHRRILAPAVAPAPGRIESEKDNVRAWDGVASRIAHPSAMVFFRPNRHLWRNVQSQIVQLQAVDIKLFIRLAYQWRLGVH